jgi:Phytanoyl-CoA dioxygenase (PhyH)
MAIVSAKEWVEAAIRDVTQEELVTYREKGWVKLPSLLAPDITAALLKVGKTMIPDAKDQAASRAGRWYHSCGKPSGRNDLYRAVVFSRQMAKNASRLLEASVPGEYETVRYWTDNLWAKFPASAGLGDAATPFHQDYDYEHSEDRSGKVNFWIALDHVLPEGGALRFFSGSHQLGVLGASAERFVPGPAARRPLLEMYPRLPEWCPMETAELAPGDATVHTSLMVHGGPMNTTERTRWSFDAIYIQPDACFSGGPVGAGAELGIAIGQPFDHPSHPLLEM